jgi:hypothetical protein
LIIVVLVLTLCGCSEKSLPENAPKFVDRITANDEIKKLIFGSHGWQIYHPYGSSYVYAQAGYYVVRYSIEKNAIDRVLDISGMTLGHAEVYSADGEYAVIYYNYDIYKYNPKDLYLVDFEKSKIEFWADKAEEMNVKRLPKVRRKGFDTENVGWGIDYQNLDKLNYTILGEYSVTDGMFWFAVDSLRQKREITELRNNLNGMGLDAIPCVAVSPDIIAAIVPTINDSIFGLGHNKFVLIELSTGHVVQECSITGD